MLSKKQAKAFFLGGTVLFFLIFLAMSIHSVTVGIPKNTHEDQLNAQARHGKLLWEQNNCMGCHTLMGEGAYYAPELTRVYSRRGPDYIRTVLNTKGGGWRGVAGRKMVEYDFTKEEIEDIVEFFAWMDKVYLNGFPAKPSIEKE